MEDPIQPTVVYQAKVRSFNDVVREMCVGVKRGIYPGLQIFKGGVLANYRNSLLGVFWDIVAPLFLGLVFILLYNTQAIGIGEVTVPYPVFVIIGVMVWQCFADALQTSIGSIRGESNMLKHVNTYPESIMYSNVFKVGFNTIFRVLVILGTCLYFDSLNWTGLLTFLLILPLVMLPGFVIGFLFAPVSLFYGDVSRAITILLTPMMFASGAVFPIESRLPALKIFNDFNPLSMLLIESRSLITGGGFVNVSGLLFVGITFVIGLIFAWYFFHISLKLAVERT